MKNASQWSAPCVLRLRCALLCAAVISTGVAAGAVTLDETGRVLIVNGTSFTAEEAAKLNANEVDVVRKVGASTLEATGIASFAGDIRIEEGVYRVANASGFGTTAGKVYVTEGGVYYTSANQPGKEVHIAGSGNGTYTALVKSGCSMKLVMDGDATISFLGNFCKVADKLDMNGYTLTQRYCGDHSLKRSECYWPKASDVLNPGHIVLDDSRIRLTFNYSSDQLQGSDHTITIRSGELDFYGAFYNSNWTLICQTDVEFGYLDYPVTTAGKYFQWGGPIEIGEGRRLSLRTGQNVPVRISGPISGPGKVVVGSDQRNAGRDCYLSGANTYSGGTEIRYANLVIEEKGALPPELMRQVSFPVSAGGDLLLQVEEEGHETGFSAADLKDALDVLPDNARFWAYSQCSDVFEYPYALRASFDGYIGYRGPGRLLLSAPPQENAMLRFRAETNVWLTANGNPDTLIRPSEIRVDRGRVTLSDAGVYAMGYDSTSSEERLLVSGTVAPYPELVLTGRTAVVQKEGRNLPVRLHVGDTSQDARGRIVLESGAVLTNVLDMAMAGSSAECVQRAGTELCWKVTGNGNDAYIAGVGGGVSYVLEGGVLLREKFLQMGNSSTSISVLRMSGGKLHLTGNGELHVGFGGSSATFYQTGGLFVQKDSSVRLATHRWLQDKTNGGRALWALEGEGTVADLSTCNNPIYMAENTNCVATLVVASNGVLKTCGVWRANVSPNNYFPPEMMVNNKAYVHADGGVFLATKGGVEFFGTNGVASAHAGTLLDKVTVGGGGLVFDTDRNNVSVSVPLEAPTGLGVVAIALPEGVQDQTLYGNTVVEITGAGSGASAVTLYDSRTQRLTGIRVTSPGWGYEEGTTRAVVRGGSRLQFDCEVTLGPSESGNLVKRGTGTLTLKGTNTYGGRTVLEDGALALSATAGLPDGTTVELAGGRLIALSVDQLPTAWAVDVGKVLAQGNAFAYTGDLTFPEGSRLTLENVDIEALEAYGHGFPLLTITGVRTGEPVLVGLEDQTKWAPQWSGNVLRLSRLNGTMLIIR